MKTSISQLHKLRNAIVNNGDSDALIYLKEQAFKGLPYAQYLLGEMYYQGEGIKENFEEATKWLCLATDAGSSEAMIILAYFFDPYCTFANSIFESKRAIKCYKLAEYLRNNAFTIFMERAETEEIYVAKWLADCYQMGWGCEPNMEKSVEWEKKCPDTPYPIV